MANGLSNIEYVDNAGSFMADGLAFKYSYSARSDIIFISDKTGRHTHEMKPPYAGTEGAMEFLGHFEEITRIKAMEMSSQRTDNLMDLAGKSGSHE
jgi:hypothetical protein